MPIALTHEGARRWLESGDGDDTDELRERLTRRYGAYETWAVSQRVNSPENDEASLVEPVAL